MFGSIFNKKNQEGVPPVADANQPVQPGAQPTTGQPVAASAQEGQAAGTPQAPGAPNAATDPSQTTDPNIAAPVDPNAPEAAAAGQPGQTGEPGQEGQPAADAAGNPPTDGSKPAENGTPGQPGSTDPAQAGAPTAGAPVNPALQGGDALSHLDPRAAQSLNHAQEEARRIKQQYIEPDQLLIGLIYDEQLYKFLEESGVNAGKLAKDVQAHEKMGTFKGQPTLSQVTQGVFEQAYRDAKMRGSNFAAPEDVFVTLFSPKYTTAAYLKTYGLQKETTVEKLAKNPNMNYGKKSVLEKYALDLTQEAREGKLDPIAGREKEIDRMVHILVRRTKNNPIIIGETGVGKTAIVEGLAQLIASGNVPKDLKDKRIFQLDVASLIAGASHRGEFEERLRGVISEVLGSNNTIVLFIDEVHVLMGAGEGEGMNAANLIKPHLARGHLQIIGATTTTEYRKNFEKDKAFERRFQPVTAEEPSEETAFEMLKVLRPKYEKFHHITFPDDALKECVKLSKKYIGERYLPDKAIDLLDEAASEVKLQRDKGGRQDMAVKKTDIEKVVSAWTGIPITKLTEDESEKLLKLEERIHERLIDQQQAVVAVSEAVRRGRIGLAAANRPIASFVFLGPTGVGKTELAKCLAELLFGRDDAMARLDMSEYMEKHEVAKLIGAPPGYVGYEEGGQLTEAVRKKPYSIVLFDEIEKGHPDVFNMLLQLLEDGRLTDNKGNTISFKNTIVICTSNIGSAIIQKQLGMIDTKVQKTPEEFEKIFKELQASIKEELIKFFRPELLNRFDEVVIFRPLLPEHMAGIARLGIAKTAKLLKEQAYILQITEKAIARLAKDGYDPVYGARPLRRLIQTAIENPIALAIIAKKFAPGDTIVIDYNDDVNEFTFSKGGGSLVTPLTDGQFKAVLLKIVHPENITSVPQRKIFTDLHTKVAGAAGTGHKLSVAIMKLTDATPDPEIQKLRKDLEAVKGSDLLAKEILDVIDSVARQIQASQDLKKVLLEIIDPAKVSSAKKRETFMQLHDLLVAESQKNNPLALRILAVKADTTSDVIEQLMEDLNKLKAEDNELALAILAVVNVEVAEDAEEARALAPETRYKRVLRELVNPLYLAPADMKEKFAEVHDKLVKARDQNVALAAGILSVTDITSDDDVMNIKKQLEQAKADGDPLAVEVLDVINTELMREPLRKLKKTIILINNPLTSESSQEREDYTVLRNKLVDAGEKGNKLAATLMAVTDAISYEDLEKLKDQLKAAKEQNDEMATLVLEAAGISLGEALAASDVKARVLSVEQLKSALLYLVNPLKADSPEKRAIYTALHDKATLASQANNVLAKSLLALPETVSDDEVKKLKDELEKAKVQNDEIATLVLIEAWKEPAPQEEATQEASEEVLLTQFKKTLLQVVTPALAQSPEKVQQFADLNTKATAASQSGNELAKKILAVTEAASDEDVKKLKDDVEKAKGQNDELAVLLLGALQVEVTEALKTAATAEPVSEALGVADVAAAVDTALATGEQGTAPSAVPGEPNLPENAGQAVPASGTPGQDQPATEPAPTAAYQAQQGEPFSGAEILTQPAPALGMEPVSGLVQPTATEASPSNTPGTVPAQTNPAMTTGSTNQPAYAPPAPSQPTDSLPPPATNGATFGGAGAAMQPTYNYTLPPTQDQQEVIE